ncbi:hypothetical protein [Clostridium tertium]|uniref:hypothetical protein n=1 Tax=Clostridium tertium TaxID=1559 RepID=UPI0018AA52DB|nr:hypothetical protein [Clostridium tertium]MDB1970758.1 hypothetical protein [Clostridium tertium]
MEEKLIRALEATGLPVYALERPETIKNCIVYKYSESNDSYSDDEADIEKYTIYINLYCESGLNKYKKLIKESMKSEGFGLEYIAPAHKSKELATIQQAFTFIYVQKNI